MANTYLFYVGNLGDYPEPFGAYRAWASPKKGSLTVFAPTEVDLGRLMQEVEKYFASSSEPIALVPPNKDWGNIDPKRVRPLDEAEVREVVAALRGK